MAPGSPPFPDLNPARRLDELLAAAAGAAHPAALRYGTWFSRNAASGQASTVVSLQVDDGTTP